MSIQQHHRVFTAMMSTKMPKWHTHRVGTAERGTEGPDTAMSLTGCSAVDLKAVSVSMITRDGSQP